MKRILLVAPNRYFGTANIWKGINRNLPPLGLAALAAYLKLYGHSVQILDMQTEQISDTDFFKKISDEKFDFIGITITTVQAYPAYKMAKKIKEKFPNTILAAGGAHPSVMPEEVLKNGFDFAVIGEGEKTFLKLVHGENKEKINGLAYIEKGKTIINPPAEPISDLNELPMPAYELLPLKNYKPTSGNYKKLPAMSIVTSRGCPGQCTYCCTKVAGKKIRQISVRNLIEQINFLMKNHGIKEINFYDDTFTVNKKFILEFCDRLLKNKINLSWSCMSRVDCVNFEILTAMKKAGCHQIGYGLESANPQILKNIKKFTTVQKMEEAVAMTKKAGINIRAMFMLGNPGETPQTLDETLKFCLKINPDIALFNITTPLPGTEMFSWAKENNILLTENWDDYDLSKPIMNLSTISNDYILSFYKKAYKKFYMRLGYLIKRLWKIRSFNDIKLEYEGFLAVLGLNS